MFYYFYPCVQYSRQSYSPDKQTIPSFFPERQFPKIDTTLFTKSAISMKKLMKEAELVLNRVSDSKEFADKLMSAAQLSKASEVNRLIKSTGIHGDVDSYFNPDGIRIKLASKADGVDCCTVSFSLRWL